MESQDRSIPGGEVMENKFLMMHILDVHTALPFCELFQIDPGVLASITKDMKENGFDKAHPLVLWGGHDGTLIDGHTRLQSAKNAGLLEVAVVARDFADELTALEYAIAAQRNRRNLTDGEMAACLDALDKRMAVGRPQKTTSNEVISGRSSQKTAELLGTSATKVEKMRTINTHAAPGIKKSLATGDISVNKAYNETMKQRRTDRRHLPEFKQEDVKRIRLETLENSIGRIVATRIEREVQEYPEIRYSQEEREDLIKRTLLKVADAMRDLPVEEETQATN